MASNSDDRDKKEARTLAIVLVVLISTLAVAAVLLLPALSEIVAVHMAPGLGLKDAAVIAFFTTLVVMIIFALVAGEGFVGEIQFMLLAFFAFFVIIWLLLAWVF